MCRADAKETGRYWSIGRAVTESTLTVNDQPMKTRHEVNISAKTAHSQSVVPVVRPMSALDGFELMLENALASGTVSNSIVAMVQGRRVGCTAVSS